MRWIHTIRERMDALGLRQVWRVIVFVIGMTVVLLGVVMIVLPGPATLVIPAGLAILGLEFAWARRWLARARTMLEKGVQTISRRPPPAPPPSTPPVLRRRPEPAIRQTPAS